MPGSAWSSSADALLRSSGCCFFAWLLAPGVAADLVAGFSGPGLFCAHAAGACRAPTTNSTATHHAIALFMDPPFGPLPVPGLMERLLGYVTRVLPPESAALVRRTLGQTLAGASTSLLSLGALGALWAAAAGMVALIDALNVAHGAVEARSWWARRLVALILTVGLALFVLTALVSVISGERVGPEVAGALGLGRAFTLAWGLLRWPLVVGGLLAAVLLVYHSAPAASPPVHRLVPGSACAVAAWLLTSSALRVYVAHFGSYDATYGSIGGVIVLMLWFYLSSLSLLVGAEINMLLWEAQAGRGAGPPDSRRA